MFHQGSVIVLSLFRLFEPFFCLFWLYVRKLKHPNIVRLHASYQDTSCYYLVMEFCPGGTLAKFVGEKTMSKDDMGLYLERL